MFSVVYTSFAVQTLAKTTTSIDAEDVEDCFAGSDSLQISTTSLHRCKIVFGLAFGETT